MKWESGNERPVQPSPGFPNVVRYERCDYLPPGMPVRSRVSETLFTSSPPTYVEIQSPRTVSSDMYKVINRPPAEVDGIPNFRASPVRTVWSLEQDVPYPLHGYPGYYPFPEQPGTIPGKEAPNARRTYDNTSNKSAETPPKVYEPGKDYEPAYSPAFTEELRRSEYIKSINHPYNPGLLKSYVESYNQGFVHLNGYTQDDADRIFGKDMTPNPQFMVYPHFNATPVYPYNPNNPNRTVHLNRTVSSSTADLPKKGAIRRHSILKPQNQSSHSLKKRAQSPSLITRNIYNLSTPDSSPQESPIYSRHHSPPGLKIEENPPPRADRESQTNTSFLLKNFLKREQKGREREEFPSHRKIATLNPVSITRIDGTCKEKKKKQFLRKAVANDSSSTFVYDSRKQRTEESKMVKQSLKDQETETNPLETFAKGIQTSATNLNNKQYRTRSTSVGTKQAYNERGKSPVVIHILEIKDEDKDEKEEEHKKKPHSEGAKRTISMSSLVVKTDVTDLSTANEKGSKFKKSEKRSKSRNLNRKCSRDSIRDEKGSKRGSPTRSEVRCGSKSSPSFAEHKITKSALMESRKKLLWKRTSEEELLAAEKEMVEVENEKNLESQIENEKPTKEKKKRKSTGSDDCGSPCKEKIKSGTASPKERHLSIAAQRLSTKPKTYDKRSMYRCGALRPEPETPHNWQCFMMHKQELDEHRLPEEVRATKKRLKKPTIAPTPSEIPAGVENELRHLKSQLFHLRKEWAHFSSNSTSSAYVKDRNNRKPIQIDPAEDWIVM